MSNVSMSYFRMTRTSAIVAGVLILLSLPFPPLFLLLGLYLVIVIPSQIAALIVLNKDPSSTVQVMDSGLFWLLFVLLFLGIAGGLGTWLYFNLGSILSH